MEQASLLDQARDAIIVKTLDGRITYCNRGAARLYGIDAPDCLTDVAVNELHFGPALPEEAKSQVLEQGEWSGELQQKRKDATPIIVRSHLTLVRDTEGRPSRILAINTDVTEHRKLQDLLLRTQRLESIGMLAGGIAHDLNNVLLPIIMAVSILKEDATDPDALELFQTIEESANRGTALVRQVLAFARGIDGTRVSIDIRQVVTDVARIVKETFPKNITLHTCIGDDPWPLRGDPTHVHQVLLNLCVNARDAMPQGGVITIAVQNVEIDQTYATLSGSMSPGRHVRIVVEDTGTGVPRSIIDKIFDPFFTTKPVGNGTGLGLSTVASIVRSFGGAVTVDSEPGHGSRFCVYLPSTLAKGSDSPQPSLPKPLDRYRGAGQLILVVDDEESVRAITRLTLTTYGYQVLTAVDGADALAIYARQGEGIDLVLTDMRMPIMSGPAMIHAMKRMDPAVRIIAASGLDSGRSEAAMDHGGVRRFLEKPYTAERLLEAVHSVLSEAPEASATADAGHSQRASG